MPGRPLLWDPWRFPEHRVKETEPAGVGIPPGVIPRPPRRSSLRARRRSGGAPDPPSRLSSGSARRLGRGSPARWRGLGDGGVEPPTAATHRGFRICLLLRRLRVHGAAVIRPPRRSVCPTRPSTRSSAGRTRRAQRLATPPAGQPDTRVCLAECHLRDRAGLTEDPTVEVGSRSVPSACSSPCRSYHAPRTDPRPTHIRGPNLRLGHAPDRGVLWSHRVALPWGGPGEVAPRSSGRPSRTYRL